MGAWSSKPINGASAWEQGAAHHCRGARHVKRILHAKRGDLHNPVNGLKHLRARVCACEGWNRRNYLARSRHAANGKWRTGAVP